MVIFKTRLNCLARLRSELSAMVIRSPSGCGVCVRVCVLCVCVCVCVCACVFIVQPRLKWATSVIHFEQTFVFVFQSDIICGAEAALEHSL